MSRVLTQEIFLISIRRVLTRVTEIFIREFVFIFSEIKVKVSELLSHSSATVLCTFEELLLSHEQASLSDGNVLIETREVGKRQEFPVS